MVREIIISVFLLMFLYPSKGQIFENSPEFSTIRTTKNIQSLSYTRDINRDGNKEILIGSPQDSVGKYGKAGRVYIIDGETMFLERKISSPNIQSRGLFGSSVSEIDDVNEDGIDDLAVGAPGDSLAGKENVGRVYILSGGEGQFTPKLIKKINPVDSLEGMEFGSSLSQMSGSNGDERSKLLIGSPGAGNRGRVYLVNVRNENVIKTLDNPKNEGGTNFGESVEVVGDINEKGENEFAIGDNSDKVVGESAAGRVYIYSGESGNMIEDIVSKGVREVGFFGTSISSIGDVDGDEISDIAIGAPGEFNGKKRLSGRVYIFSGKEMAYLQTVFPPNPKRQMQFGFSLSGKDGIGKGGAIGLIVGSLGNSEYGPFVYEYDKIKKPVKTYKSDDQIVKVDKDIPNTSMDRDDDVAVIIGNKEYEHPGIPDVKYAFRDSRVFKKYAKKTLGLKEENILYVENASGNDMERIFGTSQNPKGELYDYVRNEDSEVFVYYSGHGAPSTESESAYFVPHNANPDYIQQNGYSVSKLYKNLSKLPSKNTTVIIEACFSGVTESGSVVSDVSPAILSVESPAVSLKDGFIFTAGAADQVSTWYNQKSHGLFTYYFLNGLRGKADLNKNEKLTVREMEIYLNKNIPDKALRLHSRRQVPQVFARDKSHILVRYTQ